jgi:CheY-like chemotaxis protein
MFANAAQDLSGTIAGVAVSLIYVNRVGATRLRCRADGARVAERSVHALIIEDEYFVVVALRDALCSSGFTTFEDAHDVGSAIKAASCRCPDLIIADQRRANGTGTDAVLTICAGKSVPVVFVTASEASVRERLPEALVVPKPFSHADLGRAIAQATRAPLRCC